jgi:hypothetical protein
MKDNYIIYFEFFNNLMWFHTDVFKWSARVKREYLRDLQIVRDLINIPLLAFVERENVKLNKFATSIGMEQMQEVVSKDGAIAYIYCWR